MFNCKPTQEPADGDSPRAEILNTPKDLIGQTYKVIMMQEGDARYAFEDKQPKVTFKENNSIGIQLSVNSCGGTYETTLTKMTVNGDECTEACCDTKDEMMLMNMFRGKSYTYQMDGNKLKIFNEDLVVKMIQE